MHMVFVPGASQLEKVGAFQFDTIPSARTMLTLHENYFNVIA